LAKPLLGCTERADRPLTILSVSFLSLFLALSICLNLSIRLPPFPALSLSLFSLSISVVFSPHTHASISSPLLPSLPCKTDLWSASHAPHAREEMHPPYAVSLVPYSGHCMAQRYGCFSQPGHSILPPLSSSSFSRTQMICDKRLLCECVCRVLLWFSLFF
jgi:hypothetical protein